MQNPTRNPLRALWLALGAAGLLAPAQAQQAPAAPATRPPAAADEAVLLSPFTVSSEADRGYQALNTLSGTRLNSKLEDLGASITVVTKQQLLDTAAVDLNDIFLYEVGTEAPRSLLT